MIGSKKLWLQLTPFIFVLLWSTGFIGAKYGLPYIEPFNLLFIRMLITLAVFLFLIWIFKANWLTKEQAGHQMVVGFLIHACYLGGVFAAIRWQLPAGITSLIVGLQPLLTAILAWRCLDERLTLTQWLGLGLGLLGVSVILVSGNHHGDFALDWRALVAVALSLAAISIGSLYQKRYGAGVNLLTGSFFQYLITAVVMGLLSWQFETGEIDWSPTLIGALIWLVFGLSVSAILLLMLMIREGESAKVASYFYLVPPVTALQAWFLFGEQLAWSSLLAMLVTVAGVYLVIYRRR